MNQFLQKLLQALGQGAAVAPQIMAIIMEQVQDEATRGGLTTQQVWERAGALNDETIKLIELHQTQNS